MLLLVLKAPLEFFRAPRARKRFQAFTLIDWVMEWIVEMLEIFSGYLANTLSFMRVAGLGIAHVSLMIAFFAIAGMMRGPGRRLHAPGPTWCSWSATSWSSRWRGCRRGSSP